MGKTRLGAGLRKILAVPLVLIWWFLGVSGPGLAEPFELNGYESQKVELHSGMPFQFSSQSLGDLVDPALFTASLTLDVNAYLNAKIPQPVREYILAVRPRILLVPVLWDAAVPILRAQGFASVTLFKPKDHDRVRLFYGVGEKASVPYLIVTNLFGDDRIRHLGLECGNFLARNGLSVDCLRVCRPTAKADPGEGLCRDSLQQLTCEADDVVVLGYRGALNYVLSDWNKAFEFFPTRLPGDLSLADLDEVRRRSGDSHLLNPAVHGNPYFPYWVYHLKVGHHRSRRLIAFRNLYGDQTAVVLRVLLEKGFRSFALIGNGGGFENVQAGMLYAPRVVRVGGRLLGLPNTAARAFPGRALTAVSSVLEESESWLARMNGVSLVDVEMRYVAETLGQVDNAHVFAAILVSDLPGKHDITRKEEDSREFLAAKRTFFFRLFHLLRKGF